MYIDRLKMITGLLNDPNCKKAIMADIEDAIENIFLKYQDLFNINDGGVVPGDQAKIDDQVENLADLIIVCLKFQANCTYKEV